MKPIEGFSREDGFSALWVAVVALFLVGAAALAVDASGAFQTARTDQTTADLSCLAGARELPDDQNAAIDVAATYAIENWPSMASATLTKTLPTAVLSDGNGNTAEFDAEYDGDDSKMYVKVTEQSESWFSRAIGTDSIPVSQEAWCRNDERSVGGGGLPFGAQPGGFNGNLQKLNPCETGNCGPLAIDRDDVSGTGPTLIKNIADGPDRKLAPWPWPMTSEAQDCNASSTSAGDTCHIVKTDTGVSASHLGEGLLQRLEKINDGDKVCSFKGRDFNCDEPKHILGGEPDELFDAFDDPPPFWNVGLHGEFNEDNTENHYYWNDSVAKCDSTRLGFMPIVSEDMDWTDTDPPPPFPNGKKTVKIVGFYWVIIIDPNEPGDWQGSGNLKQSSAHIIWFGDEASCDDGDITLDPTDPTFITKSVLLVNETN